MILRPNIETLTTAEMIGSPTTRKSPIPDTTTKEAYLETTILVPETEKGTKTKLGALSFANSVFDVLKGKTWREALRHATNSSVNLGTVKEASESANITGPLTSSEENDKDQSMWNSLFRALAKEAEKASNSGPSELLTEAITPSANVNLNTDAAVVTDFTRLEKEQIGYFTITMKPKVTTAMPESNHYTKTSIEDEVYFDDMKKPQDIVKPIHIQPITLTSITMKPPTPASMTTTTTQSKTPAQSTTTRCKTLTTMEGSAQGTLITTSVTAVASESSLSTSSVIFTTEKSKTTPLSTSALSSRFPSTTRSTSPKITIFLTTISPTPSRLTTLTTTPRSTSIQTNSKTTPTKSTGNTTSTPTDARNEAEVRSKSQTKDYSWLGLISFIG